MTDEGLYQFSSALRAYLTLSNNLGKSVYYKFKEFVDNEELDEDFLTRVKDVGQTEESELIKFLEVANEQTQSLITFLKELQAKREAEEETENEA
jgi:NAD-dependent DNA ligase